MRRGTLFIALVLAVALAPSRAMSDAIPQGVSYINYTAANPWVDAEKSPLNNNSTNLCWAATAANVLWYTGWGRTGNFHSSDDIYNYYIDHWTDQGSLMYYAWGWFFEGVNYSQGMPNVAQVDVPGGGFYTKPAFQGAYVHQSQDAQAMSAIKTYLQAGRGVGVSIYTNSGSGHALTVWGYNYDPANPSKYYGLWVSDSDDNKLDVNPPDRLRYYEVAYVFNSLLGWQWRLQDFYGTSNTWYIGEVQALAVNESLLPPPPAAPEPGTLLILLGGGAMLAMRRRRMKTATR
jgi:hypothetical protein